MIAMKPRLIYLARRKPGLAHEEFVRRWRQHGELGMSQPRWVHVERYAQCLALDPHGSEGIDGVASIRFRSLESYRKRNTHRNEHSTMIADEALTFARPIVHSRQLFREHVFNEHGKLRFKLFVFIRMRDSSPAACGLLPSVVRDRAARLRECGAGYSVSARWLNGDPDGGLRYDVVEEASADSIAALKLVERCIAPPEHREVAEVRRIATVETILCQPRD